MRMIAVLSVLATFASAAPANAETWTLGYDGVLELSTPATEVDLTFRLCDAPVDGACAWEEVHAGVPLVQGHFAVRLGTGTATDGQGGAQPGAQPAAPLQTVLETHRWMEVVFEGTALAPRVALDAVPLAVRAGDAATLAGQGPGAFAAAGHGHDDRYPTDAEVQATVDGKANAVHDHAFSDVTGQASASQLPDEVVYQPDLTAALNGYYDQATCDARFAAIGHAHDERYYPKAEVYTKTEADARYRAEGVCPSDMVPVGDFCVDRYEASVWGRKDGGPVDCEALQAAVDEAKTTYGWNDADVYLGYDGAKPVCSGTTPIAMCVYRQYGTPPGCDTSEGCDDYPNDWPDSGNWTKRLYACAVKGVTPSRSLTWFQSQQACGTSGRHLITNGEWQMAVAGTPDPGVNNGMSGCITAAGGPHSTGFTEPWCRSKYGADDMIGNLSEWVGLWGQAGQTAAAYEPAIVAVWPDGYSSTDEDGSTPGSQTADVARNINGKTASPTGYVAGLPFAAFRGGHWHDFSRAGAFLLDADLGPSNRAGDLGFRCARARLLNLPVNAISTAEIRDGSLSFADLGPNDCPAGGMPQWNDTAKAWTCAAPPPGAVDTLQTLKPACAEGQVPKLVGSAWTCSDDLTATEAQVDAWVANNGFATPADLTVVDDKVSATEARLYCLEHCNPATHETCKALTCDGVAQTCTTGTNLPDGTACITSGQPGRCAGGTCCTPATCSELGATCGLLDDLCGGLLACGNCTAPATCQGMACCTPKTCDDLGKTCGMHADGCDGTTPDCGTCRADQTCTNGSCGCATVTCGDPAEPAGEYCCPALDGYTITCNAQQHCEYANVDPTGWKQHDVWVYVPPGTYPIGSPASEVGRGTDEGPWHIVTMQIGYLVGKYEVTAAQYEACRSTGNCSELTGLEWDGLGWGLNNKLGRESHPQNGLSWEQSRAFCGWAAPGGRLPSEAEWEAAASGPVHRKYPWGDSPDVDCDHAVFDLDGGNIRPWACDSCTTDGCSGTKAVGSRPSGTAWSGAFDMAGNVSEWCDDWKHNDYVGAPTDGSAWLSAPGSTRIKRGGGFNSDASILRSATRSNGTPDWRYAERGARCVRPLPATACTWQEDGTSTPHTDSCPTLPGYFPYCNRQGHCEYANNDRTGWKAWDVWIWVAPGSFWMGSPMDEAGHMAREDLMRKVSLTSGYFVAKYLVTTATYEACQGASPGTCSEPSTVDWEGDGWGVNTTAGARSDHPQNGLTWDQAGAVCEWLGGRLPSEAQWEYAATGPVHRLYPWGDAPPPSCTAGVAVFDEQGNQSRPWGCDECTTSGCSGTKPVGAMPAGAAWSGALDMAGNLWEWCEDWFYGDYNGAPTDGSAWTSRAGSERVVRGSSYAGTVRTAYRFSGQPGVRVGSYGVRCARDLP